MEIKTIEVRHSSEDCDVDGAVHVSEHYRVLVAFQVGTEADAVALVGTLLTATGKLAGVGPAPAAHPPAPPQAPAQLAPAAPEPPAVTPAAPEPPAEPEAAPRAAPRAAPKPRRKLAPAPTATPATPEPEAAPAPSPAEPPAVTPAARPVAAPAARTGVLHGVPIPAQVVHAKDFVPIVSWLRAQGYSGEGDIYGVCVSTFRDEIDLLLATPDEAIQGEIAVTMIQLGMAKSEVKPKSTPPAPKFEKVHVAEKVAKAGTLREILTVLMEDYGIDDDEKLVAMCTELTPHVPLLQRITNLRDRVKRSRTLIGRPEDGPIVAPVGAV